MERQGEQFTAAALRRAGINANRAEPEVIDEAFNRIGQQFDDVAARNAILPGPGGDNFRTMAGELSGAFREFDDLVPRSQQPVVVRNLLGDVVRQAKTGQIDGPAYQSYRSRLDRMARQSAANPEVAQALRGIRDALDNAMERSISNPDDFGLWKEARRQYRNMLVLEKAASGAGENAALGLISPSQLRNAAVNKQGRRNYTRGRGDFAELARAGEAILKPLPQSGTAPRIRAQNLAALGPMLGGAIVGGGAGAYQSGDVTGALAGAAAGAMTPRVVGKMMMSGPGQRYLSNRAMQDVSPLRQAIINALLNSEGSALAGRLGAP
jgi:hypothetical protein